MFVTSNLKGVVLGFNPRLFVELVILIAVSVHELRTFSETMTCLRIIIRTIATSLQAPRSSGYLDYVILVIVNSHDWHRIYNHLMTR